jgi:hypothetical protein
MKFKFASLDKLFIIRAGEIRMATYEHSREQRLRKQAELQSLYTNLVNLREREASYIEASMTIPERLVSQIKEVRQEVIKVERELLALGDETLEMPARQFYREAFEAESAEDLPKAIKLYKRASRHAHPDAGAALRSIRYFIKTGKAPADTIWTPASLSQSRSRLWIGLTVGLVIALMAIFAFNSRFPTQSPPAAAVEPTATPTPPAVILIIPDTPTPTPTMIPTDTPAPIATDTPPPTPTEAEPTETPTAIPTLRSPPKIIGPKDGLVWKEGTIVFEFEDFHLGYDELYCLNTLRGFDETATENWSHPSIGSKIPSIPIEASVFKIAKIQGIQCVVWSAYIGAGSCDNVISESTAERVIGMPQVCDFKK